MDDGTADGLLMNIIQQNKGIDSFFDAVFGFLRRNTDFYTDEKKAEQIIVGSCQRRSMLKHKEKIKEEELKKAREA